MGQAAKGLTSQNMARLPRVVGGCVSEQISVTSVHKVAPRCGVATTNSVKYCHARVPLYGYSNKTPTLLWWCVGTRQVHSVFIVNSKDDQPVSPGPRVAPGGVIVMAG